jgi:hypothetical protein
MKTSRTERELADVYAGAEVDIGKKTFASKIYSTVFCAFIAKHSRKYPELMFDG